MEEGVILSRHNLKHYFTTPLKHAAPSPNSTPKSHFLGSCLIFSPHNFPLQPCSFFFSFFLFLLSISGFPTWHFPFCTNRNFRSLCFFHLHPGDIAVLGPLLSKSGDVLLSDEKSSVASHGSTVKLPDSSQDPA